MIDNSDRCHCGLFPIFVMIMQNYQIDLQNFQLIICDLWLTTMITYVTVYYVPYVGWPWDNRSRSNGPLKCTIFVLFEKLSQGQVDIELWLNHISVTVYDTDMCLTKIKHDTNVH